MPARAELGSLPKEEIGIRPEKSGAQKWSRFLEKIGRPDLTEKLSSKHPWVSFPLDHYDTDSWEADSIGSGGLGILEADKARQAKKIGMPFLASTLHYSRAWYQRIEDLSQREIFRELKPENSGYAKVAQILIPTNNHVTPIDIYQKGNVITAYEPNLGEVYAGNNGHEHRLYQQVIAGFAKMKDLLSQGLDPAVIQLEEAPVVFAAVAYLDHLCQLGMNFNEALKLTREKTLLTNHTLEPAANGTFSKYYYEQYVFKNLATKEVKQWLSEMIDQKGGNLNPETIALEIAGHYNGVSILHSKIASGRFSKLDGTPIDFPPITNGISLDRWIYPSLLALYQNAGLIDEFDLPAEDLKGAINQLSTSELRWMERRAKNELLSYLELVQDQYGKPIFIPPDATTACWARRLAEYKRPRMIFENPERLAQILEDENIHLLLSGKAHPDDMPMKEELNRILTIIDTHPILKERVHFIQDYNDITARYLLAGADLWINTPRKGREACGTSWAMAVANRKIVISTCDGGVADLSSPPVLEIVGNNEQEEVESLYWNLTEGARMTKNDIAWREAGDRQLEAFLPIISPGVMWQKYLNLLNPLPLRE